VDFFFRSFQTADIDLLVIFAPKWLVPRFFLALENRLRQEGVRPIDLIFPASLKLLEKEKELQRAFLDVRRFWVKDIPDIHIRGAAFGGVMLQDSPEYARYVKGGGGRLMSIAFKWRGVTIMISADGTIFTYSSFPSNREIADFFWEIIEVLSKVGVIHFVTI
jgi:hypothetical protein